MLNRAVLIVRALTRSPFPGAGRACARSSPLGMSFRALCGPEGTAAEPSGGENAPCWPAAMAGEAHPVPSRTRKLSPLAPMVLRCSPWESRTPPASKGRFAVNLSRWEGYSRARLSRLPFLGHRETGGFLMRVGSEARHAIEARWAAIELF